MRIVPASLADANAFVTRYHRHHDPVTGHKFSIAVVDGDCKVRGVAMVGHPIARMIQSGDPGCLEILRLCTDGYEHACSFLYAASWRAAKALGFTRLITYTLPSEGGASLRAAGWRFMGDAGGGSWERIGRTSVDTHPLDRKWRWEVSCEAGPVPIWPESPAEAIQLALEAV